jgi:hypothetical protein
MNGFYLVWCNWIKDFIQDASAGIRFNHDIAHYFETRRGLRKGDP